MMINQKTAEKIANAWRNIKNAEDMLAGIQNINEAEFRYRAGRETGQRVVTIPISSMKFVFQCQLDEARAELQKLQKQAAAKEE